MVMERTKLLLLLFLICASERSPAKCGKKILSFAFSRIVFVILSNFLILKKYIATVKQQERTKRKRVLSRMDVNLKCREDPVVLKLDSPEFHNILTPDVMTLKALFEKYQFEIRLAGGAVRDLLLGIQPKDLDFATTATPDQMKEMFTSENVRLVNMNGEKHGTITPRINDNENFEVTTLRVDLVTDGRHADVEFTTDWKLDANRRDLTINSMFLGFDGSVYDYFYGYDDLQKRRVVFVGDPDVRVKEDYLRILRYFRFYGRISDKSDNHDEITLQVLSRNVDGLNIISGERIWTELKKILQGKFVGEIVKTMLNVGIGKHIGLPSEPNVEEFERVWSHGEKLQINPMCLLAALLTNIDQVTELHARLKFSSYDRDLLYFVVEHRGEKLSKNPLLPYQKLILTSKKKPNEIIEYVKELLKYNGQTRLLEELSLWKVPKFPVNGSILQKNGVPTGKMYGPILNKLKDVWADSDYTQSVDELVKMIPGILSELEAQKRNQHK